MILRHLLLLPIYFLLCTGYAPFPATDGQLPFIVHFDNPHRALCVGSLVAPTVVLTAATCVISSDPGDYARLPLNVVLATEYRHPHRGIKVQVTKILVPKMPEDAIKRFFLIQQSVALLILKKRVPSVLADFPTRSVHVDFRGDEVVHLQEECITAGWHFHTKFDKKIDGNKFLLSKQLYVQFLNIVKQQLWCSTLTIKLQKTMQHLNFKGFIDQDSALCLRDPERYAQPCYGMFGAPLICNGRIVAVMTSTDSQWHNCTGFSALYHRLNNTFLSHFFECVSPLFDPDYTLDMNKLRQSLYMGTSEEYLEDVYDSLIPGASSSSEG